MTGPTHALIGIATVVSIVRVTGTSAGVLELLFTLIGSLAPDVDGDGSITRPGKLLGRFLPRSVARIFDELGQLVTSLVRLIAGHRGFFHWPILALIMIVSGIILPMNWLFWFGCGYLSHILADMFTFYGVPLLGPFSTRRFSLSPLRTGSWGEVGIFTVIFLLVCISGFGLLPDVTRRGFIEIFEKLSASR